jgi:hypothetical protein
MVLGALAAAGLALFLLVVYFISRPSEVRCVRAPCPQGTETSWLAFVAMGAGSAPDPPREAGT